LGGSPLVPVKSSSVPIKQELNELELKLYDELLELLELLELDSLLLELLELLELKEELLAQITPSAVTNKLFHSAKLVLEADPRR
jgi:hypothetical protein